MTKPIDKTKKANRRCISCTHWSKCRFIPMEERHDADHDQYCDVGGKAVAYWNCCSHFEWNPRLNYTDSAEQ